MCDPLGMAARPGPSSHLLGVVSALGIVTGCEIENQCDDKRIFDSPPEVDPNASEPMVLAGEWIAAGILELRFTQPVSSSGDLDPNRFAIITWTAQVDAYGGGTECLLETNYRQLGAGYYQVSVAEAWIGPEDDSIVRLRMTNTGGSCPTRSGAVESGLMLVYTSGADGGPALLDADGELIPDLGPAWAVDEIEPCLGGNYYYCSYLGARATGHLPEIQSLASIPCP